MDPEDTPTTIPPLMLSGSVWALRSIADLARLAEAHRATTPAWASLAARTATSARVASRRSSTERAGGAVAVLPLTGVLTPHGSLLSMLFGGGGGGLQDFRENFREAVASPDVGAIVLDIDSPGGLHALVPETAAEIRDARGSKPIIAVANTMAASGAYWIGAQADEFVVTPSGDVGSVGVYMLHEDWSVANEKMGIAPTYISAGKYKTEGNMDEPLSDDALAYLKAEVNSIYSEFLSEVAQGRGVTVEKVRADYGEGRTLRAQDALAAGMVDRVDTIETVIGGLLAPNATGGAVAMAGRRARILALRAEVQPPVVPETPPGDDPAPAPAEPEVVPPADPPAPGNDPTHVPADPPPPAEVEPEPVVEPNVGPDAEVAAAALRARAEQMLASA